MLKISKETDSTGEIVGYDIEVMGFGMSIKHADGSPPTFLIGAPYNMPPYVLEARLNADGTLNSGTLEIGVDGSLLSGVLTGFHLELPAEDGAPDVFAFTFEWTGGDSDLRSEFEQVGLTSATRFVAHTNLVGLSSISDLVPLIAYPNGANTAPVIPEPSSMMIMGGAICAGSTCGGTAQASSTGGGTAILAVVKRRAEVSDARPSCNTALRGDAR